MKQQSTNPISYVCRHIVFFLLCGLLPACFLALVDNSDSSSYFWVSYFLGDIASSSFFSSYINSHLLIDSALVWLDIVLLLISWALLTLCWSVIVYRTDRHMQLGILLREGLLNKSMSIVWRVAIFLLLMFIVNELTLLLIVVVMYVMSSVIIYSVVAPTVLILTVVQKAFMFTVLYVFMVSLPAIVAENYSLVSALGYSARLNAVRRDSSQAILVVAISMFGYIVSLIVRLLSIPAVVGTIIIGLIIYMWIIIMPVVVCARFITDIDTERRDVKNNLF